LNLSDRFVDQQVRAGRGAHPALVVDRPDGVERVTYEALSSRIHRLGHVLIQRGLDIEDRVLVVLPDDETWPAAFFAALHVGCTVALLNPSISAEELAFYLEDSRARGIITNREVAARLPGDARFLRARVVVDDDATREEIDRQPVELEPAPTLEEDFAVWLYSSGSTGAPKAAVHRAGDFIYNIERYAKKVLRMSESDVTVSVPKLFFGYATGSNLMFPLYFGGTAVLFPDRPTPERLFGLIERHRATILINVPTMIAQMAAHWSEQSEPPDVSSLRLLTSAGEALPPELYRRWMDGPGVEILDGIGSAEMFHVFISSRIGEVVPGSLGRLVDGYDAKIVDLDGRECGPDEVGTLWVRGDSAAAFYWQRQEKSRDVLQGRWVVTGDQFLRDADGLFWYQGRADDMMKVSGRWVSPQEIEDALTRHPAVAEAGVAAFETDGLVKPMAFVVLRSGHDGSSALEAELSAHVAQVLAPFKAPRFIDFLDALPRGDRDKLDRKALAAMAAAAAEARG
jgi:benzoate-CoA ligase